ncbi:MAG: DNA topoisomerase VI subunit B [Candidatus Hodarchaeota archaeon]
MTNHTSKPKSSLQVSSETESVIRRGEVAEFFRKRTQLVGFSMELHKFTQYCAEFSDNSLDALEAYYWKQEAKSNKQRAGPILLPEPPQALGYGVIPPPLNTLKRSMSATTISERIKTLVAPVREILNHEPILIMILQELEKPEILPSEIAGRNLLMYSFETIDTGIGMTQKDLQQYGLYLASSKSLQLRQTRGSQGFGASSAFSDAQNTTGRPVVVASRHPVERQGHASIFFTTSKNKKDYILKETPISMSFNHGTYLRLTFLNLPYRRAYADEYVRQTSYLNAHINIIFIDPYGEIHLYPRRVQEFVKEPSYALPHPASTSIGDFQDLIRNTTQSNLISLLSRNYCRLSVRKARQIISKAAKRLSKESLIPTQSPKSLSQKQVKALYSSFIAEKYYAPPTETVVPVGETIIRKTLKEVFNAEFVEAVSRPPTSSKGLAFAVEVAAVYDPTLPNQSGVGVLYRFVNRTPKLRDNSDCAIWKAAASVNWRNYRMEVASNGLPTGSVRLVANVVGPFVHLIFKAQSKQALAEDDILLRELKLAFEEVGRKLRRHIVRVITRREQERRADVLLKYSRQVARSLVAIQKTDSQMSKAQLEALPQQLEEVITKIAGIEPSIRTNLEETKEVAIE